MKRLLLAGIIALGALLPGLHAAKADTYCFSTGITILGEPWLSHEQCFDCPIGPDCPGALIP